MSNSELASKSCEACRSNAPHVSDKELPELMNQIPEWAGISRNGILQLEREFRFRNFVDALSFANRVGDISELEDHHPVLLVEWGKVTVTWWSHKISGLHKNDFIMAARTDGVMESIEH